MVNVDTDFAFLDPYSTSQEKFLNQYPDLKIDLCCSEVLKPLHLGVKCIKNAPYICFVDNIGKAHLVQGCCNSWTCPRCGNTRAKQEYWRMVNGAVALEQAGEKIYMHTLTCRGLELSIAEAEANYGKWTNHFITNCRDRCKAQGDLWAYCQVTERQKRAHPHSHLISPFLPDDSRLVTVKKWGKGAKLDDREVYISDWYAKRLKTAGLGEQYEITEVRSAKGCATYFAKYLFKDAVFEVWPDGWRRVRYSQSWPKPLEPVKLELAFAIIKRVDWQKVDKLKRKVYADTVETFEAARRHMQYSVTLSTVNTGREHELSKLQ